MQTLIIKNISPIKFWTRLSESEKLACITWSRNRAGWKKLIAFDPIDIFKGEVPNAALGLHDFVTKNSNNFVIGYLSYDFGNKLYNIPNKGISNLRQPDVYFMAYENYIGFEKNKAIVHYSKSNYIKKINEILNRPPSDISTNQVGNFKSQITKNNYNRNFNKIINYIKAGDIYQVNYTHPLLANSDMFSRDLFLYFLKKNPVDFAAYLEGDDFAISSLSPERFIKIDQTNIVSQPIKGTIKRGNNKQEDIANIKKLIKSSKEKAELFMIVDLIRNDLGKICRIGSVKVTTRRAVQTLPKVFHTYSKVSGRLNKDVHAIDALISMFPGGSITGCPKKRAMEIINEIEPNNRGVYTGSIGYILPNGESEFNIAIRTVVQKDRKLYLGVGGGITIESEMEAEYQETLAKAQSFINN